jgi:galactokinase
MPTADARARALFEATFDSRATGVARAPGRVNLMGDHTDYNGGFVLPIAIDRDTHLAFRPRTDTQIRIVSEHGEPAEIDLADLSHGDPPWSEYVRGVAWAMDAHDSDGWDGAVATDVPLGAGLSSSASLEIAVAEIFATRGTRPRDPLAMAEATQRAENDWVGMECGIMDQLSVAASVEGSALLIDCEALSFETIPVPVEVAFVVLDTSTRRMLTSSAYSERRATCERAADRLGVASLRQIDLQDLESIVASLDEVTGRRVRHVVTENDRVTRAAIALRAGDLGVFGSLMNESHTSLRVDFQSSTPQLDTIVEIATSLPGCFGARVTGAGFGGCVIAAVASGVEEEFEASLQEAYARRSGLEARTFVCRPAAGSTLSVDL